MNVSVTPSKKKAEKTAISEALRAEIIRIATEGSIEDDGALTPQVLSRLGRVAKTGRDVLVAMAASPKNLAALIKRRRMPWGGMGLDIPDDLLGDDMDGDVNDGVGIGQIGGGVLAPSPMGENFGMLALRELIAGMKEANKSPDRLVEALATARREGLDDVARKLEEQLGMHAGDPLPATKALSDVEVKISFPDGKGDGEGATGLTRPTGCPPGEPGDAGPAGVEAEGGAP